MNRTYTQIQSAESFTGNQSAKKMKLIQRSKKHFEKELQHESNDSRPSRSKTTTLAAKVITIKVYYLIETLLRRTYHIRVTFNKMNTNQILFYSEQFQHILRYFHYTVTNSMGRQNLPLQYFLNFSINVYCLSIRGLIMFKLYFLKNPKIVIFTHF